MGGMARWGALAVVFLVVGLAAQPVRAQDEEFIPEEEEVAADKADFSAIDDLLKMDEEVQSDPQTYSYDPGSRRDPFRSLQRRRRAGPQAHLRGAPLRGGRGGG